MKQTVSGEASFLSCGGAVPFLAITMDEKLYLLDAACFTVYDKYGTPGTVRTFMIRLDNMAAMPTR